MMIVVPRKPQKKWESRKRSLSCDPGDGLKRTESWLVMNFPEFIAVENCPSASPNLNPLDFCLRNSLEEKP
ncbi:hypothetical protein Trydic_g16682 [Trypoxylus dichotomus]